MQKEGTKVLSGENTFKLYDTYGFPIEMTVELAKEKGLKVNVADFDKDRTTEREVKAQSFLGDVRPLLVDVLVV